MEKKYNVMIELLQEAIIILSKDGEILEANSRLYDWLGYGQDELAGKNILALSFLTEKAKVQIKEELFQNTFDSEILRCELDFITKSGETRFGGTSFHRIKDEAGNVTGIFVIITDISEQKVLEAALMRSFERENQAYQQGRLEIIDSVLHNIGNSINSIMVGIGTIQGCLENNKFSRYLISLADAVKSHQEDFGNYVENDPQGQKVIPFIITLAGDFAKYNDDLMKIANRVSDMARHIGDIIQMDRVFGMTRTYPNYTNIRKLIYDAICDFGDSLSEKDIKIITDWDSIPHYINLAEVQVHQALLELIKKSIEAIEDIRVKKGINYAPFIKIKCYAEYKSIILEATHNGVGIEKDELAEIHQNAGENGKQEKDFRFSSIFNLANRLGGRIQISSSGIHEGATMRIFLPFNLPRNSELKTPKTENL